MTFGPDVIPESEEVSDVKHFQEFSLALGEVEAIP